MQDIHHIFSSFELGIPKKGIKILVFLIFKETYFEGIYIFRWSDGVPSEWGKFGHIINDLGNLYGWISGGICSGSDGVCVCLWLHYLTRWKILSSLDDERDLYVRSGLCRSPVQIFQGTGGVQE